MLQVLYEADGQPRTFSMKEEVASIGRATDNDIVLNDFSVSRRHAYLKKENEDWVLYDNGSTNGVRVNDETVPRAVVKDGDEVLIGTFTLRFRDEPTGAKRRDRLVDSTSTCIRPIAEFNQDFGLDRVPAAPPHESTADRKRVALDVAYKNRVFEILVQVAKALISADDLATVLDKVMDLIFEFLPVDRGFLLLEENGALQLRISRYKSARRHTSDGSAQWSRSIVDMVVKQKVAVLTSDAQTDQRFESGESIRMQQIRTAMCAPLWNGDSVIGVIYLDSPLHAGSCSEQDLDLLTALSNFAAVAIERARLHDHVLEEKRIRGRLERYHSPQVVEEIIRDVSATGEWKGVRTRVVTVLFADLVGFTTWSEKMTAEPLARMLNEYFTLASEAIFACGGTIDKFIGDAVMAFFGAPLDQADHAERAVDAALRIREGVVGWNKTRTERGELPLEVRIALNTGDAIVGDIGSQRRVDYTVLGNAVNVAARMEEFVAQPGDVVVGPVTFEAIKERYDTAQLGRFALKGLSAQVPLYKVLGKLEK
ncbi:MAG TPA: adenylate/guanylate cyclase domain-containing protein [Thermoanaerobaculia bacterium]|jgi:adenylate cyclase